MMRSIVLLSATVWLACSASAEPGAQWQIADPQKAPWSATIARDVQAFAAQHRPTAIMVVQDDVVVASWGDIRRKVNVRSVRKSLLSALFGIAVDNGQISLANTLAELNIDDIEPALTPAEKQATVGQLLMARSGVYHAAAYETPEMKLARPARESHGSGTLWYYNNWDFNALGTIYSKAVGEDIFKSFDRLIARPIGMEDFSAQDGSYVREASSSHPAYVFSMSSRDLARFGVLFLNQGRWNGSQVIPSRWVTESTTSYSETDRRGRGYGYLWWVLAGEPWGAGAFMASGNGGQLVVVVPTKRLVVVEVVDLAENNRVRTQLFLDLVRKILAAGP
jgi:CubicO group peptidase (beta-lactamase class C family)